MPKLPAKIKPYWNTSDGKSVLLYLGDVIDVLKGLPEKSVHMVVTSPPYWGLRDYQTGTWIGGDPDCSHKVDRTSPKERLHSKDGYNPVSGWTTRDVTAPAKLICPQCGANRIDRQIGSEKTPDLFVAKMVDVFREAHRVLRDDGTLWLNLGDTWGGGSGGDQTDSTKQKSNAGTMMAPRGSVKGLKPGNMVGIPWRVALALQADGWILRQDIIWCKPGPMPESVRNRCTKSHEYIFLFVKKTGYYYDAEAIKEKSSPASIARMAAGYNLRDRAINSPDKVNHLNQNKEVTDRSIAGLVESGTANKRSVWTVSSAGYEGAHFATYPPKLIEPCILAGTSKVGCCVKCGAPWKRIVESNRYPTRPGLDSKIKRKLSQTQSSIQSSTLGSIIGNRDSARHCTSHRTLGWEPTCDCGSDATVPCVVLDPFVGSATTCCVALSHGRHSIGIDLSEEYLQNNAIPRIQGEILQRPSLRGLLGETKKMTLGRKIS